MSLSKNLRSFLIEPYDEETDFGSTPALELTPISPAPSYSQSQLETESDQQYLIPRKPIAQNFGYFPTDQFATKRTNTGLSSTTAAHVAKQSYTKILRRVRLFLTRSGPACEYRSAGFIGPAIEASRFTGWRFGVLWACIGVGVCLLAELVFLITALVIGRPESGVGTLYAGSCDKVRNLTIWILLPFNVVGTILIASSNYVMQCLNAPTRKDIDDAHSNGHYVNIGISSIQNLVYLADWKISLWWLLGLTTVPIHLLLNSVVFASLQANDYGVMVVDNTFLTDGSWNQTCTLLDEGLYLQTPAAEFICRFRNEIIEGAVKYTTLNTDECIRRYANDLQSTSSSLVLFTERGADKWANLPNFADLPNLSLYYNALLGEADFGPKLESTKYWPGSPGVQGSLLLAYDDPLLNISSLYAVWNSLDYRYWAITEEIGYHFDNPATLLALQWEPTTWLCNTAYSASGNSCSKSAALSNATDWKITPSNIKINSCYSVETAETCSLKYSLTIIITVLVCDTFKLFAMWTTLRKTLKNSPKADEPIATLGDAIQSFLDKPDPMSAGRCLLGQTDIRALDMKYFSHEVEYNQKTLSQRIEHAPDLFGPTSRSWQPHKKRLYNVPSRSRWTVFATIYFGLAGTTIAILYLALSDLRVVAMADIWNEGIGTINPNSVFGSSSISTNSNRSLLTSAVIINTPQLLFSFLYYVYNGMFTCMMSGYEWGRFANKSRPRTLRVTSPQGLQRSTYWLSLPWRFSLPLLAVSATMHWLVSRSLFIVNLDAYNYAGVLEPQRSISKCGFSVLAMVLVMMLLALMLLAMVLISLKRVSAGITVVGTCSWAISGACHDVNGEEDAALKPLMWGVTERSMGDGLYGELKPGHCSITSREVDGPVFGHIYA